MDTVLLSIVQQKLLIFLCQFSTNVKFKLLYRATRDGFGAIDFHSKCDRVPNTLTIIKSKETNYIFGGFTRREWNSDAYGYEDDVDSFLFSLVNKENKPILMPSKSGKNSIFQNKLVGPCFGCANDIFICDHANKTKFSYTNLGSSFSHPIYPFGSLEAMSFLTGTHYNFRTAEIEVFALENYSTIEKYS
jgi:hypothetical protein